MIIYHVDKSSTLVPNQEIDLLNNISLDTIFEKYNNSFSNHGFQYLNQYNDSSVWELCLEFVRVQHFSHYPSRLQSCFGVKLLEDALIWKGYISHNLNSKINICKIECDNFYEFDARWITNPPIIENTNSNTQFNIPSIAKMLQLSYKYWNMEYSENPLKELILVPPVKVIEIIN